MGLRRGGLSGVDCTAFGASPGHQYRSSAANGAGRNYTTAGFTAVQGVTDTEMRIWGVGIAQNFDAAATAVYLGYRHMEADIICTGAGVVGSCVGAPGAPATKLNTEGIDVIVMGARVLF